MHRSYRTRRLGGAAGWEQPPGWGQAAGWSPIIDDGPLPLRAAGSVARWWWPTLATGGFLAVAGFVLGHDDPAPGLSRRGLAAIALAAVVVVLLSIRRTAGPGPLARAIAEYTLVAVLAGLLATTGLHPTPPAGGTQASVAPDHRPALVKTLDGFRDWLATWWEWANQEYDRRTSPPTTTRSQGRAMAPSPAPTASTRRPQ